MKVIIHRGTHQIGGCITEIRTEKTRIFIDLGSELPDENGNNKKETLEIEGVTKGNINCDGILFTHYHGDHIGMLEKVLPKIPLYVGKVAKEIYYIYQQRVKNETPEKVKSMITFEGGKSFSIGDIHITPIMVDHSAYDSYMFLIEADSKKILHTGDFRLHGFRGKGVIPAMKKYVGNIDLLVTEGTNLSIRSTETLSEYDLQKRAKELLNNYKYVFVICSSTNIDRLGAFHEATPRGKYFICDNYQKDILDTVKHAVGHLSPLYRFAKVLTYGKDLPIEKLGFCMPIRSGKAFEELIKHYQANHNSDTILIYSMWEGYIKQQNNSINKLMEGFHNIEMLHSSGHATRDDIKKIIEVVKPKKGIIPIHTQNPDELLNLDLKISVLKVKDKEEIVV